MLENILQHRVEQPGCLVHQFPYNLGVLNRYQPAEPVCDNLIEVVIPCCKDNHAMGEKWIIAFENLDCGFMLT